MTITDPGKVQMIPQPTGLRDLSDPVVREQIANEARQDAKKSILRARRSKRLFMYR